MGLGIRFCGGTVRLAKRIAAFSPDTEPHTEIYSYIRTPTDSIQVIVISGKNVSLHSYTLWRNAGGKDDDIVISPGTHGEVILGPLRARRDGPADAAAHNIAEMKKAIEEAGKWETKLKESPLGITQQDFVAYYREVIALFAAWCTANDIHLPQDRN